MYLVTLRNYYLSRSRYISLEAPCSKATFKAGVCVAREGSANGDNSLELFNHFYKFNLY